MSVAFIIRKSIGRIGLGSFIITTGYFSAACNAIPKLVTSPLEITSKNTSIHYYEPMVSDLDGVLVELVFPGRPNYESIEEGDEKEEGWYLQLPKKIDVSVGDDKESKEFSNRDEKDVDLIQLAIDWDAPAIQREKHKFKVGAKVHVKGTLFSRRFGHHHTAVLIFTDEIRVE